METTFVGLSFSVVVSENKPVLTFHIQRTVYRDIFLQKNQQDALFLKFILV